MSRNAIDGLVGYQRHFIKEQLCGDKSVTRVESIKSFSFTSERKIKYYAAE